MTDAPQSIYTGIDTTSCGDFKSKIGVRTDDIIVIGWIDGTLVPLVTTQVRPQILADLPPAGPPVLNSGRCNLGSRLYPMDTSDGYEGWRNAIPLVIAERNYILNWMFKYGGNDDPIIIFRGP